MYSALMIADWFIFYNETKRELFDEDTDEISNLKLQNYYFMHKQHF